MRIYLAGLHGFTKESEAPDIAFMYKTAREYPYHLESYHYIKNMADVGDHYREIKRTVFLDSGAFTMFTKKVQVSLAEYAAFIQANNDWIHVSSNLDEIGRGKELESYQNQKELTRLGVGVQPVHHARDADEWLLRYMAEGHEYVFLGGMVPETKQYLFQWLDHIWEKCLTRKDGSAKIRVHGFGLTTLDLVERYPWYSVDSTRWIWLGGYGQIFVDLPDGRDVMVHISSGSPRLHKWDAHYDTMAPMTQEVIFDQITKAGFTLDQLRTMYGARHKWNIEFFRRICAREPRPFIRRQVGLLVD